MEHLRGNLYITYTSIMTTQPLEHLQSQLHSLRTHPVPLSITQKANDLIARVHTNMQTGI